MTIKGTGRGKQLAAALIVVGVIGALWGRSRVRDDLIVSDSSSRTVAAPPALGFPRSDEPITNPERGFFRVLQAFSTGDGREPLSAARLRRYRDEGAVLVMAYYVIDEFRDRLLTRESLDAMQADFAAARTAGVKLIPRYTYTYPCAGTSEPCNLDVIGSPPDAPLERVLAHIDQLAPLLRANSDVIAFLEAGFIGAWGEWHHSTNGLVAQDRSANANSAAILDRLLSALPEDRMLTLRYPYHKRGLYGVDPLTPEEAFTRAAKARLGAHNDCFVSNSHDSGTYAEPRALFPPPPQALETLKTYLSLDNRFVPQAGETCSFAPAAEPYFSCANALQDLERMRWTALGVDFNPDVIRRWRTEGCFAEVERRLGARLRLVDAEIPVEARPGSGIAFQFTITNDGWGSLYNPRQPLVVMRHRRTGRGLTFPVSDDPRFWASGEVHAVLVNGKVPDDAEGGEYDVLFNLPDPDPRLDNRPEYSIRLANTGFWEPATGSNVLPNRVTVVR